MKRPGQHLFIDVDESSFERVVLEYSQDQLVLVDFWAEWCPPCVALSPTLERVADEFKGRMRLCKVEVDDNMRLAGRYKLRGFPTVIFFHKGQSIDHFAGNMALHLVRERVEAALRISERAD